MPTLGVDIKHKCPQDDKKENKPISSKRPCKHGFEASLRNVYNGPNDTDYKVCQHYSGIVNITRLTYGGQELKDADKTDKLELQHGINDISVYYSDKYDKGGDERIKVPLILGIKESKNEGYTWYENTGDNVTWKRINDKSTPQFLSKLNELACQLHNLHFVDIYQEHTYKCACGETVVTKVPVEPDIKRYIKYQHKYGKGERSIRYGSVNITDEDGDPLPLDVSEHTSDLSVYYWNVDKEHRKPLVIGVVALGATVYYGNIGEQNNEKWTPIGTEPVSEEKLKELTCTLFKPVVTDCKYDGLREKLKKLGCYGLKECTQDTKSLQEQQQRSEETVEKEPKSEQEDEEDATEEESDTEDSLPLGAGVPPGQPAGINNGVDGDGKEESSGEDKVTVGNADGPKGGKGDADEKGDREDAEIGPAQTEASGGTTLSAVNGNEDSESTGKVVEDSVASSSSSDAGAGSLTGLGWWLYKRSKGDPWVRQI